MPGFTGAFLSPVDDFSTLPVNGFLQDFNLGISGQIGHEKVQAAYRTVIAACQKHGKFPGMGGIYDTVFAKKYVQMGARFILDLPSGGLG